LKRGSPTDDDIRLLDQYRRSFGDAYEQVIRTIHETLKLSVTGRRAKTQYSISQKLQRETIRLSQMQDIAGCRIVVSDTNAQDQTVAAIRDLFSTIAIVDRRVKPSHGYRAVHLIPSIDSKAIEVQVRTSLQHLWAEASEKLSDRDPALKYGKGEPEIQQELDDASIAIASIEADEGGCRDVLRKYGPSDPRTRAIERSLERAEDDVIHHLLNLFPPDG
jgi:putative GTP pyrophosphokinase